MGRTVLQSVAQEVVINYFLGRTSVLHTLMLSIVTDRVAWAVGLPVGVSVCHTSGKKGKGFPT